MDTREKLDLLGQAARYDDCTVLDSDETADGRGFFAPATVDPQPAEPRHVPLRLARDHTLGPAQSGPQGAANQRLPKQLQLLRLPRGRDIRRAHLTPDELARSFDLMYRAGVVDGMFLSSGIIGTTQTMDEMLATTELVRQKYGFRGYIHLKVLPGAEAAHIARAVELADRISVNLEGPTQERLAALAPQKAMADLIGPLRIAAEIIRRGVGPRAGTRPAPTIGGTRLGMSTQFVVGPAGESDRELLATVQMLYREVRLARAYYSAFSPVKNTPLEGVTPTHPTREHRLYQADWLLRYYNFGAEELPFDADGQLSQEIDPKAAWAQAHPERFPIEVNAAPLPELLRIPGIGPTSARAIVQARRQANLRELGDLRKLGARADCAVPFVTLGGHRPPHQPPLPLTS